MAISTNGTIYARLAGGLYNTVLSNATYLELVAQDPTALANKLYAADFGKMTDAAVGKAIVENLGLSALTGLDAWVAAQLTAAGTANKGAKIVSMLNDFSAMTADTTYGTYATAFNTKVDAALAASQTTGKAEAKFSAAAATVTSFTLTTGVDAIVGSAGDDTITAPNTVAATGAAQTTINTGDTIDGGLGIDTLTMTFGATDNTKNLVTITNVEKIVYVGVNNLATGAVQNAIDNTAATAASAALTVATNGKVAADAAKVVTAAEEAAAVYIATSGTAPITTIAAATTESTAALPTGVTAFTKAQYNAAAKALLTQADGTTLTTDLTIVARSVALKDLKVAVDDKSDTAVTTANTGLATASFNSTTATATAAASKAAISALTLAANADATSITIDGTKTTVTGLKDTQTLTIKATTVADAASYAATATVANIALSSATGTVTFTDAGAGAEAKGVVTANVSGSTKATAAGDASAVATPGKITLADTINTAGAIKTLNLSLTSDATVDASGMDKVTTIDASASTGGINLTDSGTTPVAVIDTTVMNITTGAGKDTVIFAPATTATTTSTLTASLKTGAGNDSITVNHIGTGTATVDAGAGDDSVVFTSGLGTATIDGGEGKDTIRVTNTAFSTGGYNSLKSSVTNFEVLAFSATAAVDAVKAAQFSEFTFRKSSSLTDNNFISKVADTQVINTIANDVVINAAGYVAKGSTDADGVTATSTTYAGSMTVSARGGSATGEVTATDVIVNASSVTLNVSVNPTSGTLANTPSYVALSGDVKTATITVNRGVNNTGLPTDEVLSTVEVVTNTTANTTGDTVGTSNSSVTLANTALNALGNLSSLTVSGTGIAIVNNASGTKLATIDASGMNGKTTTAATNVATTGLVWTAGAVAEAVKLGSALDNLTVATTASTYAKMDSITGFTLATDATGALKTSTSDDITVKASGTAITTFAKAATGYSTTSLDAALNTLANRTSAENLVFQTGGNTYIFVDTASAATGVADDDTVIELIGLIDLDNLVLALNS